MENGSVNRYQTKPKYVDAIFLTPATVAAVVAWTNGQRVDAFNPITGETVAAVNIPTPHGTIRASENMMVVRDHLGDWIIYSVRQFQEEFEEVQQ